MGSDGEDKGKTFDVSFALTSEEIALLSRIASLKRAKIASYRYYYFWFLIAGVALSYSGGAVAHTYYGMELDSRATALVMAIFFAFFAGAVTYRQALAAWTRQISAWRITELKEPARLQMNKDGVTISTGKTTWHAAWEAIEGVTLAGGATVFWRGADAGFMVPLRAVATEERPAFVDALKAWSKTR
jgi:hypothetical protein